MLQNNGKIPQNGAFFLRLKILLRSQRNASVPVVRSQQDCIQLRLGEFLLQPVRCCGPVFSQIDHGKSSRLSAGSADIPFRHTIPGLLRMIVQIGEGISDRTPAERFLSLIARFFLIHVKLLSRCRIPRRYPSLLYNLVTVKADWSTPSSFRNRRRHSQSGLSPFLLTSPCLADVDTDGHACMPVCIDAVQGFHKKGVPFPEPLIFLVSYAILDFAISASAVKPSASFTAISASIFLLMSTSASFSPCMNLL